WIASMVSARLRVTMSILPFPHIGRVWNERTPAPVPGRARAALAELAAAREALRHHASGLGALADPFDQFGGAALVGAARRILPFEALGKVEGLEVGDAAILVTLQAHALAARHFRDLGRRHDQHLAVLADDGDVIALDRHAQGCLVGTAHIHHL